MTGHRYGTRYHEIPMTRLRQILMQPEHRPNYKLAEAAGLKQNRLSEYALGRKRIPLHHLEALCKILNVTPAELLGPPTILDE